MVEVGRGWRDNRRISRHASPFKPPPPSRPPTSLFHVFQNNAHFYAAVIYTLFSKGVIAYFKLKKLDWDTTCTWVPWGRAAHHNAPEKILIHPLCVSLLTPDGFFVISTGFLEVPVGICSTHIGCSTQWVLGATHIVLVSLKHHSHCRILLRNPPMEFLTLYNQTFSRFQLLVIKSSRLKIGGILKPM